MSNINEFVSVNNLKRFLQNADERFAPNKNMEGIKSDGADGYIAGKAGLVPAPSSSSNGKFLRSDGTWAAPEVPTKVSELDNDSNFLTSSDLSAHTSNKNIHVTTTEKTTWNNKQNALTTQQINNINAVSDKANASDLTSHTDDTNIHVTPTEKTTWNNKANKATTLSGYGITDAYTKTQVDKKVSDLVNSAPETLDTLNELASALGNDPNFATTVANQIGTKANDSAVVHKSGDETVNGTKTFSDEIQTNTIKAVGGGGANITLTPPDNGGFAIRAFNGTVNKELVGYPSGMLAWDNNEILTRVNGVTLDTPQIITGEKTFADEVFIKSPSTDRVPTSDMWGRGITFLDSTGERTGFISNYFSADGSMAMRFFGSNTTYDEKELLTLDCLTNGAIGGFIGGRRIITDANQIMLAKNLTGANITPGGVVDCGNGNGMLKQLYLNAQGTFLLSNTLPTGIWKSTSFVTLGPNEGGIFIKLS